MASAVFDIAAALAHFTSETRLYELHLDDTGDAGAGGLLVEAFAASDALQETHARDIVALSTDAHLDPGTLLGRQATLAVTLAHGARARFSGDITAVATLGSEGGFARYRLRLTPWLWRLRHGRNSRVWQDKSIVDICEAVLQAYAPLARWRWTDDARAWLDALPERSYCCQYRETDYDFLRRLLTEEGVAWRVEELEDGHGIVFFADSTQDTACPEDATSAAGGGVRFHGARAVERDDTIQALHARRALTASLTTVLSYDYKGKKAVVGSAPAARRFGQLPALESYDVPGQYACANAALAERYAMVQMQAGEARAQPWRGRSTVRTLAAGTRLHVTQGPLATLGEAGAFTVTRVASIGINNLPAPAEQGLAELFGPIPELLEEVLHEDGGWDADLAPALAEARQGGYANVFDAVPADVPWRPLHPGGDARMHPKPTARGTQSAIVVGPGGGTEAAGSDELYCDALGRVRIRYHWQEGGDATCWVRVAQRHAGGGMGSQFLPRIGQEVLVQFVENDIDRPLILGALYNGQGEGGIAPTPGGTAAAATDDTAFAAAHDHGVSAQGNGAAGHSPVWHGASATAAGHRNAAAQWGVRSKEFGGAGYNQLVFDDTDAQGRVQLRSTSAATELTLGHLVHTADNYRGSLRGTGAELRTDAYGAVRGGGGLLVTSYGFVHNAGMREPAGDNVAGIALMKQAVALGETFSEAAKTHQTVAFGAHLGAAKAGASDLSEKKAPLDALLEAASGMVAGKRLDAAQADASDKTTGPADDRVPHVTDPILAIGAKAGLAATAGQGLQLSNGETVAVMSGGDTQLTTGAHLRNQSKQAIGVLGGAVAPGAEGLGVQLIAAKDAVDVQAQADVLNVQARDEVRLISANSFADFAAAKRISLSTAGGANITIEGGNITVQGPGKITVRAGKKSFVDPLRSPYTLPAFPRAALQNKRKFAFSL